ncbi:TrkH family potassium uptake protein [Bacillus massiliigorillae]|uniref:TrkH family potassium uptake protein n=1 Tax=Bacillus massiliigorillae TaxID=1243664 RepID=UPI0003A20538|nr:TrkH family potassium uptake protein [Bacillus massiliigorillae]
MKTRQILNKLSPARIIVLYYFLAVTISTILFRLPIALQDGVELSLIDAIFLAVSAVSVTGLSVVNITETFSVPGYFILMFVLQFGGIGIMTLGTFLWLIFRKKIGFKERQLIMTDQNQVSFSGLVYLLKQVLILFITVEAIGSIILGFYLMRNYHTISEALLQGLFMSISATTNAGFDIVGSSLVPYAHDYFIQLVNITLIIFGSIGYPVLIELKHFLMQRSKNQVFHFSLYTKLTTVTFFLLIILGTIAILALEYYHFLAGKSWHESFFYALFQSVTTRNAGLATMDVSEFTNATLFILCALMFIGASPSSVGGGIRTTTFAIAILFLFHYARGNQNIKVFKREIHEDDIKKSLVVMMIALIVCATGIFLLSISEPFSIMEIVFEVCSAFGTTGLSLGITADLSMFGKIVIIVLMFIGRVGILSFIFMLGGTKEPDHYRYPKEKVIIG